MTDDPQVLLADAARIAVEAATQAVLDGLSGGMADLANAVSRTTDGVKRSARTSNRAKLQERLYAAARRAQQATVNSYAQIVTRKEGAASRTHYRAGHTRYAGGKLRDALASDDFFNVSSKGLTWGNREALDEAAKQWHRVAFGAGGRGRGGSVDATARFEDLVDVALGYTESPSSSFTLPQGFWFSPEGGRQPADQGRRGEDVFVPFHPTTSTVESRNAARARTAGRPHELRPRQSKGIEGADFFAAGVRTLAQELPIQVDAYIREVFGDWERALSSRSNSKITRIVRTKSPQVFVAIEKTARRQP